MTEREENPWKHCSMKQYQAALFQRCDNHDPNNKAKFIGHLPKKDWSQAECLFHCLISKPHSKTPNLTECTNRTLRICSSG